MIGNAQVRKAGRAAGFAAITFVGGTSAALGLWASPDNKKPAVRDLVTAEWSKGLLRLFGVEIVLNGAPPGVPGVGRGHGRVIVSNHRSIIDIAILLSTFGGAVLSRAELAHWPIVGSAARAAGTIFVDRGDKAGGQQAISAMVDRLLQHDTICVFPEGTTYVDDEVRPFKPGAFVAAERANVPVVPVGLVYPDEAAGYGGETFVEHLARLAETPRTETHVEIGVPLEMSVEESVDTFRERCRGEVARLVGIARERSRLSAKRAGDRHRVNGH